MIPKIAAKATGSSMAGTTMGLSEAAAVTVEGGGISTDSEGKIGATMVSRHRRMSSRLILFMK